MPNYTLGLDEHIEHVLSISLKTHPLTLDSADFKQLARELAIGICVHDIAPSIFFEVAADGISPILPPAYRHTLVGDLLTEFAYTAQGYLSGGMRDIRTQTLVSFKEFFWEHHPEVSYNPLSDFLEEHHLNREPNASPTNEDDITAVKFSGIKPEIILTFQSEQAVCSDHCVTLENSLALSFNLRLPPHYANYFQNHIKKHGRNPEDYVKLGDAYAKVCTRLVNQLPLYAPELIAKVQIIQSLATYFQGLKNDHRLPDLSPMPLLNRTPAQITLPYLYASKFALIYTAGKFLQGFQQVEPQIWLALISSTPVSQEIRERLIDSFRQLIRNMPNLRAAEQQTVLQAAVDTRSDLLVDRMQRYAQDMCKARQTLAEELLETYNQNKLFPCGLFNIGLLGQNLSAALETHAAHHITDYINRQNDPLAEEHPLRITAFREVLMRLVTDYLTADNQLLATFFAIQTPVFFYDELTIADIPYQAARNTISFPNMGFTPHQASIERGHNMTRWVGQVSSLQDNHPVEMPVMTRIADKNCLIVKLSVFNQYVLENTDYDVLCNTLLPQEERTIFTPEDLQKLRDYSEGLRETLDVDCSKTTIDGESVLHYACMHGARIEVIKALLEHFPQGIQQSDKFGRYPIHSAALSGNLEAVRLFIKHDATQSNARTTDGYTPLMTAALHDQRFILNDLLMVDCDKNARLTDGSTALFIAVQQQHRESALLLLDCPEIDINAQTEKGNTALLLALETKQNQVAKLLIEKGANLNHNRQTDGCDAMLTIVCYNGEPELLQLILHTLQQERLALIHRYEALLQQVQETRAYLEEREQARNAPLLNAIMAAAAVVGNIYLGGLAGSSLRGPSVPIAALAIYDAVRALCARDRQEPCTIDECWQAINELNGMLTQLRQPLTYVARDGNTGMIHVAAECGYLELIQCLVEFEAGNCDIRNTQYDNALMLALQYGHHHVAAYLVDRTAINVTNAKGETASLLAIRRKNTFILERLLERGEDPSHADETGESVLSYINRQQDTLRFEALSQDNQELIIREMNPSYVPPMLGKMRRQPLPMLAAIENLSQEQVFAAIIADDIDYLRHYSHHFTLRETDIVMAIQYRSIACLHEWIPHAAAPIRPNLLRASIEHRNLDMIRTLFDEIENSNIVLDVEENTMAHLLVQHGLITLLREFATSGVDFAVRNAHGLTPMDIAINNDDLDCLEQLVKVSQGPIDYHACILRAIRNETSNTCLDYLLKKYDALSIREKELVFECACEIENTQLISTLLQRGSISNECKLNQMILILDNPTSIHRHSILEILLAHQTNPTQRVGENSPLDHAIMHDRINAIRAFHHAGYTLEISEYRHTLVISNHYVAEALRNEKTLLQAEQSLLVEAHEQRNTNAVKAIFSDGLPINEVFIGEEKAPFLHLLLKLPATERRNARYIQELLTFLATRVNPFLLDKQGNTLGRICVTNSMNETCLLQKQSWIQTHFPDQHLNIFRQPWQNNEAILSSVIEPYCLSLIQHGFPKQDKYKQSLLFFAVNMHYSQLIDELIRQGEQIDTWHNQQTPLMIAAKQAPLKIVKRLIEAHHANPNLKNIRQEHALFLSFNNQNKLVVLYLIEKSRHLSNATRKGYTPFLLAAAHGFVAACHDLMDSVADLNHTDENGCTALHLATINNRPDVIDFLIAKGMDVNMPTGANKKGESLRRTPLHLCQHSDAFHSLIKHGGDLSRQDHNMKTPAYSIVRTKQPELLIALRQSIAFQDPAVREQLLFAAAQLGNFTLVRELIVDEKLNINTLSEAGQNALCYAIVGQQNEIAAFLIARNILVDQPDQSGNTPLHLMAINNASTIIRLLLKRAHVQRDFQNLNGETALYLACAEGHWEAVKHLLFLGAKLTIAAGNGLTPTQIAWTKGHYKLAQFLVIFGDMSLFEDSFQQRISSDERAELLQLQTSIDDMTDRNENDLHLAVRLKHLDAIRSLCDFTPEFIDRINASKQTPLNLAEALGETEIAELLTYYVRRIFEINIPIYPARDEQTFQSYTPAELELHLQQPDNETTDLSEITLLSAMLSELSLHTQEKCLTYYDNLNITDKQRFRQTLGTFLKFILEADTDFLNQVDQCILSRYSWETLFETTGWFILINKTISLNDSVLKQWFLNLVKPITHTEIDSNRWQGFITNFEAFLTHYEQTPVATRAALSSPPIHPISLQVNSDYLQRVLLVFKLFPHQYQWTLLDSLPALNLIQRAADIGLPFICQTMIIDNALETISENPPSTNDYKRFKAMTLAWVARHYSNNFFGYVALFKSLQASQISLKISHQMILIRCVLQYVQFNWSADLATRLVDMSVRIKTHFGDAVYRLVFSQHSEERLKIQTYLDFGSQMLSIIQRRYQSPQVLIERLRNDNFLNPLLIVKNTYTEMLSRYLNQENIPALRARFETQSEVVKVPLSGEVLNQLVAAYQRVVTYCTEYATLGESSLREVIQSTAPHAMTDPTASDRLIAAIRLLVLQVYDIYPHDTQVFALMMLLQYPREYKGCIGEIRTGEGKSMIIAMLALYFGVQGRNVDVITSSQPLAERDEKKASLLFTAAGVSSSTVITQPPTSHDFRGRIIYSTGHDLEFVILREMTSENKARIVDGEMREDDVVIVDEGDNLLIDSIFNAARIADGLPIKDTRWIYAPIYDLLKQKKALNVEMRDINEVRQVLMQYQEGRHAEQVPLFPDILLRTWVTSANTAYHYMKGKDYVIIVNPSKNDVEVKNKPLIISIVQFGQTGRVSKGSRWQGGVHEFVEVKELIEPDVERLSEASIAHTSFFNQYKQIFALTGTLGLSSEIQEVESLYQLCSYYVPLHNSPRRHDYPAGYFHTKDQHRAAIIRRVDEMVAANRPVLLLCESIEDSNDWALHLSHQKTHCLNDNQFLNEDFIIKEAGQPGMVTIATHVAGRGTDIRLLSESILAGGLHVLLTFLPQSDRAEDQAKGRAARQGQPGSSELIIHAEDLYLQQLLPSQPARLALTNNDAEVTYKIARIQATEEMSRARIDRAKREMDMFKFVKKFYKTDFHPIRAAVRGLSKTTLMTHCIHFDLHQNVIIPQIMLHNLLIQSAANCVGSLLIAQQQGKVMHWSSVIKLCQQTYLDYLCQQWSIVYSKFDGKTDHEISVENIEREYETLRQMLRSVLSDPLQACLTFIKQLIMLGYRSHVAPRVVSMERDRENIPLRQFSMFSRESNLGVVQESVASAHL